MKPAAAFSSQNSVDKGNSALPKQAVKENPNCNNESAEGEIKGAGQASIQTSSVCTDPPAPAAEAEFNGGLPADSAQLGETSTAREPRRTRKNGLSQGLREKVKSKYLPKTANLMVRYNKLGSQFADFSNNVAFLTRCANMMMVPKSHRVYNDHVRNTRAVVRLLDQCSYRVMIADLEHNRRRKYQVMKNRERIEIRLKDIMSPEDFEEVRKICDENREVHFTEVKERQRKEYQDLLDEYKTHETKKTRRRNNSHRTEGESSVSPNPAAEHRDQRDEAHGAAGGSYQNKNEKPNGKEVSDTGGSAEIKIASNNESVSKNSKNDDKSRHDSELPSASQKNVGTGSLALARAPKDKTEKDDKSNSKKASNKSSNIEVKAVFSNEGLAKYSKGESSTKNDGKSLNDSDLSSTLQKKSGTDVQEFAEASKEKAKETSASVKPKTNTDESSKGK